MKDLYSKAEIEIIRFSAEDIVTASVAADSFDYVDNNAWDS